MKASDEQRGPHAAKGGDKPHAREQDRRELRSPTLFLTSLFFHPLGQTEPGSAFLPLLSVCALVRTKSLLPDSEGGEFVFCLEGGSKSHTRSTWLRLVEGYRSRPDSTSEISLVSRGDKLMLMDLTKDHDFNGVDRSKKGTVSIYE
jgi:hypothetical protein